MIVVASGLSLLAFPIALGLARAAEQTFKDGKAHRVHHVGDHQGSCREIHGGRLLLPTPHISLKPAFSKNQIGGHHAL